MSATQAHTRAHGCVDSVGRQKGAHSTPCVCQSVSVGGQKGAHSTPCVRQSVSVQMYTHPSLCEGIPNPLGRRTQPSWQLTVRLLCSRVLRPTQPRKVRGIQRHFESRPPPTWHLGLMGPHPNARMQTGTHAHKHAKTARARVHAHTHSPNCSHEHRHMLGMEHSALHQLGCRSAL